MKWSFDDRLPRALLLCAMGLAILWAYWTTLSDMAAQWDRDAEYNHGWLVPFIALALVWVRRDRRESRTMRLSRIGSALLLLSLAGLFVASDRVPWLSAACAALGVAGASLIISECVPLQSSGGAVVGVALLGAAVGFRIYGAYHYFEWFDRLSLIAVAFAAALLAGGRTLIRQAWPGLLFLTFMVPLPYTLEVAMRDPLRRIGTEVTTYAMQTVGIPAFAEGHVIVIPRSEPAQEIAAGDASALPAHVPNEIRIGVVEACSGLRMLMVFFALSSAVALLTARPWWQRGIILLAAVPIALASNFLRIFSTGVLHLAGWDHLADLAFHDLAGWLMMPIGLMMLGVLLWFLDHLVLIEDVRPLGVAKARTPDVKREPAPLQEAVS